MVSRQSSGFSPIDPETFIELAGELAQRQTPAALRTAGDRAYYAAFLTSRDQLASKNYARFAAGGAAHLRVREVLRGINQRIGELLNELRVARNALTYQTGYVPRRQDETLQWMLRTARRVIAYVDALPHRG